MSVLSETSFALALKPDDTGSAVRQQVGPRSRIRAASSGVISAAAELQQSVADLKAMNAEVARTLRVREAS